MFPLKNLARKGLIMHTYVALLVTLVAGLHARLTNCFFFLAVQSQTTPTQISERIAACESYFSNKNENFSNQIQKPDFDSSSISPRGTTGTNMYQIFSQIDKFQGAMPPSPLNLAA